MGCWYTGASQRASINGGVEVADVLVTVPKSFGLDTWIEEGDLPGESWSGEEWHFYLGGRCPKIQPGERVYILYDGLLRGYAPLVRIENTVYQGRMGHRHSGYALVRHNDAVAVTIDEHIKGFRGFRYRWWKYEQERSFPEWQSHKNPAADGRPGTGRPERR